VSAIPTGATYRWSFSGFQVFVFLRDGRDRDARDRDIRVKLGHRRLVFGRDSLSSSRFHGNANLSRRHS
jgi:hypothetical protein